MSESTLDLLTIVKELFARSVFLNQEIQSLQDLGKDKDASYYKLVGAAEECNRFYHILNSRLVVEFQSETNQNNERIPV